MSTGLHRDLARISFETEKVRDIPEWAGQPKSWTQYKDRKLTTSAESHLFYHYGRTLGPGNYADVGVYRGGSVAALAHGMKDGGHRGTVYAVDLFDPHGESANSHPNADTPDILRAYFKANFPGIALEIRKGDSTEWGRKLHVPLRFAFIDADHNYAPCKADFEAWGRLVEVGGVLAFHDTDFDTVDQVVRELPLCWKLERHIFRTKAFRRVF